MLRQQCPRGCATTSSDGYLRRRRKLPWTISYHYPAKVRNFLTPCKRFVVSIINTYNDLMLSGRRGLINLGQTCFLNAVLQCLVHNPLLRTWFLADKHNWRQCKTEHCTCCEMDRLFTEVCYALSHCIHTLTATGTDIFTSASNVRHHLRLPDITPTPNPDTSTTIPTLCSHLVPIHAVQVFHRTIIVCTTRCTRNPYQLTQLHPRDFPWVDEREL